MKVLAPVLCAVWSAACGASKPPAFSFPPKVAAWKLKQTASFDAPEPVRRLGLVRAQSAEYEGQGRIEAKFYEFNSDAAALEMEQTWKPAADTVVFHQQNDFVVIHWEGAGREAVTGFVREMEKHVGGP